jgi:hypothetical protein
MILCGVWYHHILGQKGWNTSYKLLHDAPLAFAYSHLVLKSKFTMLPTTTKKGSPRFLMPSEVWENLIASIEERHNYTSP